MTYKVQYKAVKGRYPNRVANYLQSVGGRVNGVTDNDGVTAYTVELPAAAVNGDKIVFEFTDSTANSRCKLAFQKVGFPVELAKSFEIIPASKDGEKPTRITHYVLTVNVKAQKNVSEIVESTRQNKAQQTANRRARKEARKADASEA